MRARVALAAGAFAAVALTACGDEIDAEKLEGEINSQLGGFYNLTCPEGIEVKEGNNFQCTGTRLAPGASGIPGTASPGDTGVELVRIEVEQLNDDGDVRFTTGK